MTSCAVYLDEVAHPLAPAIVQDVYPHVENFSFGGEGDVYLVDVPHIPAVPAGKIGWVWPDGYTFTSKRKKALVVEETSRVELGQNHDTYSTCVIGVDPVPDPHGADMSIDFETPGFEDLTPLGFSISYEPGRSTYLVGTPEQLRAQALRYNADNQLIWHNALGFDLKVVGDPTCYTHDTQVMAWLLGKKRLSLELLTLDELGERHLTFKDLVGNQKLQTSQLPLHLLARKSNGDADHTLRLFLKLRGDLQKTGMWDPLYTQVERPLLGILYRMRERGILVEEGERAKARTASLEKIANLEASLNAAGLDFPRGNPQKLSNYLFGTLGLGGINKKTKSGMLSTDSEVLEALAPQNPIVRLILWEREEKKNYAAFLKGKGPEVHANFNQTSVVTGRLSCSVPNLQQVPPEWRKMYISRPGMTFVGADYSQVELRIAAYLSQDELMLAALNDDSRDLHLETAQLVWNRPELTKSSPLRKVAKIANFATLYGGNEKTLESRAKIASDEAAFFYQQHKRIYYGWWSYAARKEAEVRKLGYASTTLGRRRFFPEVNWGNRMLAEAAIREAVNHPIQGTSADITKSAMVELDPMAQYFGAHLVLQVHDELVYEVPDENAEAWKKVMETVMPETRYKPPGLKLKVDANTGKRWGDLK